MRCCSTRDGRRLAGDDFPIRVIFGGRLSATSCVLKRSGGAGCHRYPSDAGRGSRKTADNRWYAAADGRRICRSNPPRTAGIQANHQMIHLDTNILIEIVTLGSPMAHRLAEWLKTGEQLATSAIAWSEFLSGPVSAREPYRYRASNPTNV